jgi:hypothetical protein
LNSDPSEEVLSEKVLWVIFLTDGNTPNSFARCFECAALLYSRHGIETEIHRLSGESYRVLWAETKPGEWPDLETVHEIVRDELPQQTKLGTWAVQFRNDHKIIEVAL